MIYAESEKYNIDIDLPYGSLGQVVNWCINNCTGEWKFHENIDKLDSYIFYFDDPKDYLTFLLAKK